VWRRGLDSSNSGYGPTTSFCEHGNEPSGLWSAEYFLISWSTVSRSRRILFHGLGVLFVTGNENSGFITELDYTFKLSIVILFIQNFLPICISDGLHYNLNNSIMLYLNVSMRSTVLKILTCHFVAAQETFVLHFRVNWILGITSLSRRYHVFPIGG